MLNADPLAYMEQNAMMHIGLRDETSWSLACAISVLIKGKEKRR